MVSVHVHGKADNEEQPNDIRLIGRFEKNPAGILLTCVTKSNGGINRGIQNVAAMNKTYSQKTHRGDMVMIYCICARITTTFVFLRITPDL